MVMGRSDVVAGQKMVLPAQEINVILDKPYSFYWDSGIGALSSLHIKVFGYMWFGVLTENSNEKIKWMQKYRKENGWKM